MNREFRDLSVNEPDGRLYYDLVDRAGKTLVSGVSPRLQSPVLRKGDRWGAAAANKLLRLDEKGVPVLAIPPKAVGGLARAVHQKQGRVHSLTADGEDLRFTAAADFEAGDTFTLNGRAVSAITLSGEALWPGYFKKGAVVLCHKEGDVLTFSGGGGLSSADKETVKAFLAMGHSVLGGQVQGSYTADATAGEWDLMPGRTAYAKGQKLTGKATSDATAGPEHLLKGRSAYVNGQKLWGSIEVYGSANGQTLRPGTQQQVIPGYVYLNGPVTIPGDAALVPANIRRGTAVFGVRGTLAEKQFSACYGVLAHYEPDWISLTGQSPTGDFSIQQENAYQAKIIVNRTGLYDVFHTCQGNMKLEPGPGAAFGTDVQLSAGAAFYITPKGGGDGGSLAFAALRVLA